MNNSVVFGGASILQTPWPNWKDFTITRYGLDNVVENAYRGVGNEFIVDSTIHVCNQVENPYVMVMLTNFDKWDWYVEDPELAKNINATQRHPLLDLNGKQSDSGFWSTGSWFPEHKEYFVEHYYSEKYFFAQTLKNLYLLQQYFRSRSIPNLIMFDSPILEYSEQQLLAEEIIKKDFISDNQLAQVWMEHIDWSNIYLPGLIGFCQQNKLEWLGKKAKNHPPSISQLMFCKEHIWPQLDLVFEVKVHDQDAIAKKYQQLFYE
jgi:hypothetical protein